MRCIHLIRAIHKSDPRRIPIYMTHKGPCLLEHEWHQLRSLVFEDINYDKAQGEHWVDTMFEQRVTMYDYCVVKLLVF